MYGRMVVVFFLKVRDYQGRNVSFLRTREYCLSGSNLLNWGQ